LRIKISVLKFAFLFLAGLSLGWGDQAWSQDYSIISRKAKLEKAKDYFSIGQLFIKEGNYAAANAEFAKAELMLQEASMTTPEEEITEKSRENDKTEKEKKQVEKAMSYYLEEIKKETSNPDYYFNLAIDYLKQGQFVLAEESFKLVVNLNPLDKDACYNLGILYDNYLGNPEKAVKYYQQYLNIAPDAPEAGLVRSWIKAVKDANGER
jgi:tetratricopeptide (TPR) repeat protein